MKYGAFLNRKTLTNGAIRRSTTELLLKSVCLYDWWLIKPQEGEEGLAVAGFSSREGMSVKAFKSAAISKRLDATTLETVDGFTISLVGFINKDLTLQNGFSSEVCGLFKFGFSYNWEEYTVEGSNKVFRSHDNEMAENTFEICSINKRQDPRPENSESDGHILTTKAMEDLFRCVRDLEKKGNLLVSNDKNVNMSDGVLMPPDRTLLNNSNPCFRWDGRGVAKKFPIDTESLEKGSQFESYEDPTGSEKPCHVDRHPESDHITGPTKGKYTNVTEGSYALGKVDCNSATMADYIESHTTFEAGGTPRTISDKTTGSRRVTRSMTKEKKNSPRTRRSISGLKGTPQRL